MQDYKPRPKFLNRKQFRYEDELLAFALGLFAGLLLFSNAPW